MKELSVDYLVEYHGGGWISDAGKVIAGACAGYGLGVAVAQAVLSVTLPALSIGVRLGCIAAAGIGSTNW